MSINEKSQITIESHDRESPGEKNEHWTWKEEMNVMQKLNCCKLFLTSQTHHFSRRLFSYTCRFRSLHRFRSLQKYILLIKTGGVISTMSHYPRNVCIYTSEEDSKWMGICERLESNKSIEMFLFLFSFLAWCMWLEIRWIK